MYFKYYHVHFNNKVCLVQQGDVQSIFLDVLVGPWDKTKARYNLRETKLSLTYLWNYLLQRILQQNYLSYMLIHLV